MGLTRWWWSRPCACLGQDPAQFQELLERLWEEYNPTSASSEGLVIRLARATWLIDSQNLER